jgi:protein TonB
LEIRSILMVPVVNGEQLLGIFQIFSPRANEFGDREAQTLQALTRRIVNSLQYAAENRDSALEKTPQAAVEVEPERLAVPQSPLPAFSKILATAERATDYWTSALMGLVIALALLLGWMAGRDGVKKQPFTPSAALPIPIPSKPGQPAKAEVAKSKERSDPAALKPERGGQSPEGISNAGLIVYDKGKIIYQASPAKGDGSKRGSTRTIETLSPDIIGSLLKNRVEPEYPEAAKNARVEGDVSMRVIVDQEGLVRDVQVEDGNAQLAPAAVDAVRQWRFTPYQSNGVNQEFQARLVVHFRLP